MESTSIEVDNVTNQMGGISVEDDDDVVEVEISLEDVGKDELDLHWEIVGRFHCDKLIRLNQMIHIMASNYQPRMGVYIQEIIHQ